MFGVLGTMVTGFQEQFLGVSGTRPPHNSLNHNFFQASPNRLTLLTDLFNISNAKTVPDNPTNPLTWKLKPIQGFRFPRKGHPSLTSPMKHGGGISDSSSRSACMTSDLSLSSRHSFHEWLFSRRLLVQGETGCQISTKHSGCSTHSPALGLRTST